MIETKRRTLVKTITYRLLAWGLTLPVSAFFTTSFSENLTFTTILHLLLSLEYYVHERIWQRIPYGRIEQAVTPCYSDSQYKRQ